MKTMANDPPFKEGDVFTAGAPFEWCNKRWRREASRRNRNRKRKRRSLLTTIDEDWGYFWGEVRPAVDAHFADKCGFESVTILEDPDDWLSVWGFKVVDADKFVDAFTGGKAGGKAGVKAG